MSVRLFISILLFAIPIHSFAQIPGAENKPDYPQDYFRNPLDIPIFLAGNFGECRPGHFHSGVDIKTLGKENQPVHAAADGYISRIKMEKGGFGHGLYITHPNGYTTLYAHLNDFSPALQKYVRKEQYEKKHWDVDVQLKPDQFRVKKGQQIAWSGNTGASTAPHLHFEIRNTKTEHPLNPELFGLPVVDNMPPVPTEVVIYGDSYNSGFYDAIREIFPLHTKGAIYEIETPERRQLNGDFKANMDTIVFDGRQVDIGGEGIGIGINVNDYMNGSDNTIAFYTAQLYFDDTLESEITLDDIGYEETRYINAYADYKLKQDENKWVQCFFKLPGNHLDKIYTHLNKNKGRLIWHDTNTHKVTVIITDDKQNQSKIAFYLKPSCTKCISITACVLRPLGCVKFLPNQPNEYMGKDVQFSLGTNALYDQVIYLPETKKFDSGYSDKHEVLYHYIPVHSYFDLKINPNKPIPNDLVNKVVMQYSDDKDIDGRAAVRTDSGWYKAKVRNFGTYWLDIDTIPPVIKSLQKNNSNLSNAKQITFEVKDAMTSVKSFSGYLDGKWICFEQHNDLFFYKFDEHCPKGKHQLIFKAEDENGNVATFQLNFTR